MTTNISVANNVQSNSLFSLCKIGDLNGVKNLVSIGANIHADNEYALRWSAEDGHLDVVKYLLSIGADINIFDDFILRCIDTNGHKEVINYLLSVAAK